ncbi:uncharacterized protein ATNIH1004_002087 [Aspergillus tanneri]|uniref:Uncharacterized protein n=1 Tax=Aspergillus tanneri TaxID=1220188 RepID=A0A5M9MTY5_9EURO|nr:uncharacterized protein ATNIH1004_002087 [Aspergillus tanneri]KAA8649416.1 hypothetical protein ATNIH1004_002087 [Aspergillus tanneri]
MAATGALPQTLQSITDIKIGELSKQRDLFKKQHSEILRAAGDAVDLRSKARVLLEGVTRLKGSPSDAFDKEDLDLDVSDRPSRPREWRMDRNVPRTSISVGFSGRVGTIRRCRIGVAQVQTDCSPVGSGTRNFNLFVGSSRYSSRWVVGCRGSCDSWKVLGTPRDLAALCHVAETAGLHRYPVETCPRRRATNIQILTRTQ